jgi:hypothetical protein
MKKISYERLAELEKKERKLQALMFGGVDNWEHYDDALEQYHREEEEEELMDKIHQDMLETLGSSTYEPSEMGAGFTFSDDAVSESFTILMDGMRKMKGLIQS